MRRLIKAGAVLAAVTLAGALAACSAGAGSGGSGGGDRRQDRHPDHLERERRALDLRLQPVQRLRHAAVGRVRLRDAGLRQPAAGRQGHPHARVLLQLGSGRQVADVHDPLGRQVQQRHPADRQRRGLHVQPAQEVPGARPARRLVGPVQRHRDRHRPGHDGLQRPRGAVVLLHRRPGADRVPGHLVEGRQPGRLPRHPPGRHRALRGEPLHLGQHHLHRQPELLAGRRAEGQEDRVPGVHQQQHRQRRARQRPGPVGRAVHPEHRVVLHRQEPGLPLLVPADGERVDRAEPDQPAAEQRRRSARPSPTRSTGRRSPPSASPATSPRPTRPASSPRRSPAPRTARWSRRSATRTTRPRRSRSWSRPATS